MNNLQSQIPQAQKPLLINILAVALVVLTGMVIYALIGVRFFHDVLFYGAMFIFTSIAAIFVAVLLALVSSRHRRRCERGQHPS